MAARRTAINRVPVIYARLSRDDMQEGAEPVEVKLERRKNICLSLAREHGLTVAPEDIYLEVGTGTKSEQRQKFLEMLARISAGGVSHVITPAQDRLSRAGGGEWAQIEKVFRQGGIIFLARDTVPQDYSDPDHAVIHGLSNAFKAAVAHNYVVANSKKQRDANIQRTLEGKRSGGFACYGYEWYAPLYRKKQLIDAGGYKVVAEEYEVLCEILRRLRFEGMYSIVADLNDRLSKSGAPIPPGRSRGSGGAIWRTGTLQIIINNPFYCGYPCHRYDTIATNTRRPLPDDQWVWPKEQGEYPRPIETRAEWEELRALVAARWPAKGTPKPAANTVLSGMLRCSAGFPMGGVGPAYECQCVNERTPHPQSTVRKYAVEGTLLKLLEDILLQLPADLLKPTPKRSARDSQRGRLNHVLAQLNKERHNKDSLMTNATLIIETFSESDYREKCVQCLARIESLEAEQAALEEALSTPDLSAAQPLLCALRDVGFEAFWAEAAYGERREIIRLFFQKVVVNQSKPGERMCRSISVVPQTWVGEFYDVPSILWLPTRADIYRAKHGLPPKPPRSRKAAELAP